MVRSPVRVFATRSTTRFVSDSIWTRPYRVTAWVGKATGPGGSAARSSCRWARECRISNGLWQAADDRIPRLSRDVLILASASPRRAELLSAAGIAFEVRPAQIDETPHAGEEARTYASRVAAEKARAVAAIHPARPVLAADTVVVVDGEILGKPLDPDDAVRMLCLLSGRTHEVVTAVVLIHGHTGPESAVRDDRGSDSHTPAKPPGLVSSAVEVTTVEFAPLDMAEIGWYVASGEPADKAGAYAIQGLASLFVTRIEGSYSNVVGLPVALVYAMCTRAGILLS